MTSDLYNLVSDYDQIAGSPQLIAERAVRNVEEAITALSKKHGGVASGLAVVEDLPPTAMQPLKEIAKGAEEGVERKLLSSKEIAYAIHQTLPAYDHIVGKVIGTELNHTGVDTVLKTPEIRNLCVSRVRLTGMIPNEESIRRIATNIQGSLGAHRRPLIDVTELMENLKQLFVDTVNKGLKSTKVSPMSVITGLLKEAETSHVRLPPM